MRVLLLHAYSAKNAGDGLLVAEAIGLIHECFGHEVSITLVASHPETFSGLRTTAVNSLPRSISEFKDYARTLRKIDSYDLVVGVGGGYLRAGYLGESIRSVIVHGPQLWAASKRGGPVIYLPQSIGPAVRGLRALLERRLRRLDRVYVRDDRSVTEFPKVATRRHPDMALLVKEVTAPGCESPVGRPILTIRAVKGSIPEPVQILARRIQEFDGFVQSSTGGNDDSAAMASLNPIAMVDRSEFTAGARNGRRIVVAVRLHAALMALNAGHFVIHLAYERKGFGAFQDLGLEKYVHNVFSFDPCHVEKQIHGFLSSSECRLDYANAVREARQKLSVSRTVLIDELAALLAPSS